MITTDLLIIGGGAAGLTAAFTARGFNKKVILIEKNKLGGECTWNGCIPSKTLIKASKIAHLIDKSQHYGITLKDYELDVSQVFTHIKEVQQEVYTHETPEVLEEQGIEVIIGTAEFFDNNRVIVNKKVIEADKIILATGSVPKIPDIKNLDQIDFLTNESIFDLKKPPQILGIIGAGPIGIEMAQAFNRLDTMVKVFLREERILKNEPPEVSELLKKRLISEGIEFIEHFKISSIQQKNNIIIINDTIELDELLIATGRQATHQKLGLNKAGIQVNDKGSILLNDKLQTTNPNVYCCGDIVGPYRLSHMAYEQGKLAAMNAILPINQKISYDNIVWCVFSDPEIAHLGKLSNSHSQKKHYEFTKKFDTNDRAIITSNAIGFIKVVTDKKYKILKVNIIGPRAGELIHHFQLLKSLDLPLYKAENMIYAYPTFSEMIREIAKDAKLHRVHNNFFVKLYKKVIK